MTNLTYFILKVLFLVPNRPPLTLKDRYAWCAKGIGDMTLLLSVLGLLASILIAYPFHEGFSFGVQLSAHLGILLFATALKIGYVMRLIGHYELGLKTT